MKKSKITACISALLTPCMLFAAIVSMHTICPPPPMQIIATLPDMTGYQYKACKEAYLDLFDLAVEEELYSSEYPEGVIIEQKPAEGSEYLIGRTTVKCKISKGPRMVTVSNVIGLDFEGANNILGDNDRFRVGFVSEYSDDVPKGKVIATDPPAGEKAAYGSAVKVTVSGGKEPDVTASTEWYKELN
ncbi:MAG: PASTA domain-containing protein [Oscillospiraceae bacterium]|nr:PASTA domain-containing protein [Oscillospiraceae bacterium]